MQAGLRVFSLQSEPVAIESGRVGKANGWSHCRSGDFSGDLRGGCEKERGQNRDGRIQGGDGAGGRRRSGHC